MRLIINTLIEYPIHCLIGVYVTRYFVIRAYQSFRGKYSEKIIGDDLTEHQANRTASNDSNRYDLRNQHTISGTDEDGDSYTGYQGETEKGGWVTWIIQSFKKKV